MNSRDEVEQQNGSTNNTTAASTNGTLKKQLSASSLAALLRPATSERTSSIDSVASQKITDAIGSHSQRRKIQHQRGVGTISEDNLKYTPATNSSQDNVVQSQKVQTPQKPLIIQQNDIVYSDLLPPANYSQTYSLPTTDVGQKMKKGMKNIIRKANDFITTKPLNVPRLPKSKQASPNNNQIVKSDEMKHSESMDFNTTATATDHTISTVSSPTTDVNVDRLLSRSFEDNELLAKMSLESGTTSIQREKEMSRKSSIRRSFVSEYNPLNNQNQTEDQNQEIKSSDKIMSPDRGTFDKLEESLNEMRTNETNLISRTNQVMDQQITLKTYSEENFMKIEKFRQSVIADRQRSEIAYFQMQERVKSLETKVKQLSSENQLLRTCMQSHEEDIVAFKKSIDNIELYVQKSSQKSGKYVEYLYSMLAILIGFVGMLIIFASSLFKKMRLIKPSKRLRRGSISASDTLDKIQQKIEEKRRELEQLATKDEFVPTSSELDRQKFTIRHSSSHELTEVAFPEPDQPLIADTQQEISPTESSVSEDRWKDLEDSVDRMDFMSPIAHTTRLDGKLFHETELEAPTPVTRHKMGELLLRKMAQNSFSPSETVANRSSSGRLETPNDDEEDIMKEVEQIQQLSKHFMYTPRTTGKRVSIIIPNNATNTPLVNTSQQEFYTPDTNGREGNDDLAFESDAESTSSETDCDTPQFSQHLDARRSSLLQNNSINRNSSIQAENHQGNDLFSDTDDDSSSDGHDSNDDDDDDDYDTPVSSDNNSRPRSASQLDHWLKKVHTGEEFTSTTSSTFERFNDQFADFN